MSTMTLTPLRRGVCERARGAGGQVRRQEADSLEAPHHGIYLPVSVPTWEV